MGVKEFPTPKQRGKGLVSARLEDELNRQLNREFYSAYFYLAMASYADSLNLDGFAHWLYQQAREEVGHGMRIQRYLSDRDARVALEQIAAPPAKFNSLLEVFEAAVEHEENLAHDLENIVGICLDEHDHTTREFLNWFLTEQVEEIASTENIRDKLRIVGSSGDGLLFLDRELAGRGQEPE